MGIIIKQINKLLALAALIALGVSLGSSQTGLQAVRIDRFDGGINDTFDPTKVAVNESPNARNVIIDEGGIKPRKGMSLCGELPSGNAGKTIYTYSKSDGSSQLIASDNQNYYETPDCQNWTRFRDGESNTAIADYAVVRNKLWVVNRSTHIFTWDGSTTTLLDGGANEPNPAPPRCSYINFWKERVFCGRTSTDPSGIAFTDITDSAGNDLDPSTGTASWPATNVIQVGEESEGPIYGMHVYRDRLYAFKENSVYRINFNSRFDISVEKTASNVGTRYDKTIQEVDGLLLFTGPLGVYAFNGDTAQRLSDKIDTKFDSLRQPKNDEQFKNWSVATDFDDGTLIQISTIQIAGAIEIENSLTEDWNSGQADEDDLNSLFPEWFEHGSTIADIRTDESDGNSIRFQAQSIGLRSATVSSSPTYQSNSETGLQFDITEIVEPAANFSYLYAQFVSNGLSNRLGEATGYALKISVLPGSEEIGIYRLDGGSAYPTPTEVLIASTTSPDTTTSLEKTWQVTWQSDGDIFVSTNGVKFLEGNDTTYTTSTAVAFTDYSSINSGGFGHVIRIDNVEVQESTGSWISDKFNAVTVSSWTAFETTQDENGGTIAWQYRAATSEANLDSEAWATIIPGITPSIANTNTWIQFQSSLTANAENFGKTPFVEDVTQNYSQGDFVSQPMYSGYVDNRYWITATSGAATANNIAFVRSKDSNAWMFYDTQIGDITNFNDKWYALASTHSAVFQLENGENDNGEPISWYYETGDAEWGQPWVRKDLLRMTVEFRGGDASSAKAGWSRDSGATWSEKDLDMSGSGRNSKTFFINGGNAFDFRFRIADDGLDENATVLGITGWARPYQVLE